MNPSVLTKNPFLQNIKGKRYFHVKVRYTRTGYSYLCSSPNAIPAYSAKQAKQILQKRLMKAIHANDIRRKGKPDNGWRKIPVTVVGRADLLKSRLEKVMGNYTIEISKARI